LVYECLQVIQEELQRQRRLMSTLTKCKLRNEKTIKAKEGKKERTKERENEKKRERENGRTKERKTK